MKNIFSITFWIEVLKNPSWMDFDSDINFPPFVVNGDINVFMFKQGQYLKIYILHPEIGFRKIVANVKNVIGKDLFVAITNLDNETLLYLNSKLSVSVLSKNTLKSLEVGDFVLAKILPGDLKKIVVDKNTSAIIPAKITAIDNNYVTLFFFQQNEVKQLSIDR